MVRIRQPERVYLPLSARDFRRAGAMHHDRHDADRRSRGWSLPTSRLRRWTCRCACRCWGYWMTWCSPRSGADLYQPRHQPGAQLLRPGAGDVRRTGGGVDCREGSAQRQASLHPGAHQRATGNQPSPTDAAGITASGQLAHRVRSRDDRDTTP